MVLPCSFVEVSKYWWLVLESIIHFYPSTQIQSTTNYGLYVILFHFSSTQINYSGERKENVHK